MFLYDSMDILYIEMNRRYTFRIKMMINLFSRERLINH